MDLHWHSLSQKSGSKVFKRRVRLEPGRSATKKPKTKGTGHQLLILDSSPGPHRSLVFSKSKAINKSVSPQRRNRELGGRWPMARAFAWVQSKQGGALSWETKLRKEREKSRTAAGGKHLLWEPRLPGLLGCGNSAQQVEWAVHSMEKWENGCGRNMMHNEAKIALCLLGTNCLFFL
jgi:hypothetical protein